MSSALDDYFMALERLKQNQPIRVPKNTRITNDAVSIEAGRGKGSIKKSRPIFADLVAAIDTAAAEQSKPKADSRDRLNKAKEEANRYRELYEEAIAREVSLLHEVFELKKLLAKATGNKVKKIM